MKILTHIVKEQLNKWELQLNTTRACTADNSKVELLYSYNKLQQYQAVQW